MPAKPREVCRVLWRLESSQTREIGGLEVGSSCLEYGSMGMEAVLREETVACRKA